MSSSSASTSVVNGGIKSNSSNYNSSGIISSDLSNGLEANKLPLVNRFDKSVCREFIYITDIEVEPQIAGHFPEEKGCECTDGHCGKQITTTESDRKACHCNGIDAFCVPGTCHCSKPAMDADDGQQQGEGKACPMLFSTAVAKSRDFAFQVFMDGPKKGWALRTLKPIAAADQYLFEYAGQLKWTSPELEEKLPNDEYIYGLKWLNKNYILDANTKGNLARFCNHSCEPNCKARLAILDTTGIPHVLIHSTRPILEGEELTLDYGEAWWFAKPELVCACDSAGRCKYSGISGEDIRMEEEEEEDVKKPRHIPTKTIRGPGSRLAISAAKKSCNPSRANNDGGPFRKVPRIASSSSTNGDGTAVGSGQNADDSANLPEDVEDEAEEDEEEAEDDKEFMDEDEAEEDEEEEEASPPGPNNLIRQLATKAVNPGTPRGIQLARKCVAANSGGANANDANGNGDMSNEGEKQPHNGDEKSDNNRDVDK